MGVTHLCPNCHAGIGMNELSKFYDVGFCINCGMEDLRKAVRAAKQEVATAREANKVLRERLEALGAKTPCPACNGSGEVGVTPPCVHKWITISKDTLCCSRCLATARVEV